MKLSTPVESWSLEAIGFKPRSNRSHDCKTLLEAPVAQHAELTVQRASQARLISTLQRLNTAAQHLRSNSLDHPHLGFHPSKRTFASATPMPPASCTPSAVALVPEAYEQKLEQIGNPRHRLFPADGGVGRGLRSFTASADFLRPRCCGDKLSVQLTPAR